MRVIKIILAFFSFLPSCFYCLKEDFFYPCLEPPSICCVQNYFYEKVGCGPRSIDYPNYIVIPSHNLYLPYFNMTVVQRNLIITELDNGEIVDFYVNRATGRLVLSIAFTNVVMNATTYFGHHKPRKEVQNTISNTTEMYPSVVTTSVFSNADRPDLFLSGTQADINTTLQYNIGTGVLFSEDPDVIELFAYFAKFIDAAVIDCFFTRGPLFASYFIQNHICDYGMDYTFVNFQALGNL